jgi:hypothetical protein
MAAVVARFRGPVWPRLSAAPPPVKLLQSRHLNTQCESSVSLAADKHSSKRESDCTKTESFQSLYQPTSVDPLLLDICVIHNAVESAK